MRMTVTLPPELLFKRLYEYFRGINLTLQQAESFLKGSNNVILSMGDCPSIAFEPTVGPVKSYDIIFFGEFILPDECEPRSYEDPFKSSEHEQRIKNVIYRIHGEYKHITNEQYYRMKNDRESNGNHRAPSLRDAIETKKHTNTTLFNSYAKGPLMSALDNENKKERASVVSNRKG